jgi:2'-5' RNA ligase
MASLNYPPHVTLATYNDDVDVDLLRKAGRLAFMNQSAISLVFRAVRYFDTSPLILWAEPSPSSELMRLYEGIHQSIPTSLCRSYYRPGTWTAHSTLAFRIREDSRRDAMFYSTRNIEPIEVRFDVGDVASFHPVRVIEHWPLSKA